MAGTLLNVFLVVLGSLLGLTRRLDPTPSTQQAIKVLLGLFTTWTGMSLIWRSIGGSFGQVAGQLGLALLAVSLGHATGKLTRLQAGFNQLGQLAKARLARCTEPTAASRSDVFLGCTILCVANPLGLFGALLDGVSGYWEVLAIKAVMDGLTCLTLARVAGWPILGVAVPLLAFQGSVALLAHSLARSTLSPVMIDSLGAVGGLLVVTVSLIILGVKKVELASYLPAFLFAPILAWWQR